jgi:uncharacterized protein
MKRLHESSVLNRAERELLEQCRDVVREVVPGAELILYGSRARGDAELESDYDLLILIDGPVDWQLEDRIRQHLYSIKLESGSALSVSAYNRSDWCSPLYRAMPFNQNKEKVRDHPVTKETRTLVRYRLGRAKEALEEVVLLLESNHTNTFVNRLYYACFYAVSAS